MAANRRPLFTVLGLDPGTNSFAYCVLAVYSSSPRRPLYAKVLQHGMVNSTVRTLTSPAKLQEERALFKSCIDQLMALGVTHLIAERYMLRRGSGGTAIEAINLMLGILLEYGLPTKYVPASQWKNNVRRVGHDLEARYVEAKASRITPHQTDSAHIAHFGASALLGLKPAVFDNVVQQLITASCIHLGASTKVKKPKKKRKKPNAASLAATSRRRSGYVFAGRYSSPHLPC